MKRIVKVKRSMLNLPSVIDEEKSFIRLVPGRKTMTLTPCRRRGPTDVFGEPGKLVENQGWGTKNPPCFSTVFHTTEKIIKSKYSANLIA
jgi:hypothetical protein